MQKIYFLSLLFLLFSFDTLGLIDNRYLPFYHTVYIRTFEKRSNIDSNFFMMFAHGSRLPGNSDGNVFDIYGRYDLIQIAKSLEAVGKGNPLSPEWQVQRQIYYDVPAKIDTQGIWFGSEFFLGKYLYAGARGALLKLTSTQRFELASESQNTLNLDTGGKIQLDSERRLASTLLGVNSEQYSVVGLTDLDVYFRFGRIYEYTHKFKLIDSGLTLGLLVPVGTKRDIFNSASIPLGGNGLTGLYGMADVNLELKEDWWFGGWLQVVHRFSKTQKMRIPYKDEVPLFGALVEDVYFSPGTTLGVSAYFRVLDFRNGVGGMAQYTLVNHFEDDYPYLRNRDLSCRLETQSSWMHEYLSVGLFYDMHQAMKCKNYDPYLYINLDSPVYFIGAENVPKTFRVSLGLEVNF